MPTPSGDSVCVCVCLDSPLECLGIWYFQHAGEGHRSEVTRIPRAVVTTMKRIVRDTPWIIFIYMAR